MRRLSFFLVAMLATHIAGCTFVNIEGNNNSISDTGGHGGVTIPAAQHDDTTREHFRIFHQQQQQETPP